VPYAGRIQVAGKRVQDVQTQIEQELAGKSIDSEPENRPPVLAS
jgi:polysaccharide export outer membrane protein